jgi:hypothetical protein
LELIALADLAAALALALPSSVVIAVSLAPDAITAMELNRIALFMIEKLLLNVSKYSRNCDDYCV